MLNTAKKILQNQLARNRYKMSATREQYQDALKEGGALDFGFVNPLSGGSGGVRIPTMKEWYKTKTENTNSRNRRQTGVEQRKSRED